MKEYEEGIKNIILNEATKGEINYTDNSNKEISLYVDRLKFYENKENVTLDNINADSFINIDNSSTKKVKAVKFNLNSINEINFSSESLEALINSYLTSDVLNAYKLNSAYKRGTEKSYYEVYRLKCTSKIKTTLPKKFYIIVSYSNDNIDELYISESEPKSIKKVKKSGKISLQ